jgi:hypothetical protein
MTTLETIDKIKINLEEIEDRLKIVRGVSEEVVMMLEVIRHYTDHVIDLMRNHNIDEEKYHELLLQHQQQRILMQKLFPMYFYLNQGVTLNNSMMDGKVLP